MLGGACTPPNTNKSQTHHLVLYALEVGDLFDLVKKSVDKFKRIVYHMVCVRGNNKKLKKVICASGSVGGARPCQGRGRGFESRLALSLLI